MPDWSYQTLFRPALFRLPAQVARDWTLAIMGGLAALPLGGKVIDLMGHMRPPAGLQRRAFGLRFPSPVGLGAGLDPRATGARALERFGFGFLELGPVSAQPTLETRRMEEQQALWYAPGYGLSADGLEQRLKRLGRLRLPVGVRLNEPTPALIERFRPYADFFTVPADAPDWESLLRSAESTPLIALIGPGQQPQPGTAGLMIDGEEALTQVRQRKPLGLPIIAGGGVLEPADALALLEAGADLVQIGAGLVYSGPGLPKRINEAIIHQGPAVEPQANGGWIWALLLGWGMLIGGLLAAWVAVTRVVLPYDEAFVGMIRTELAAVNPRLLDFMSHDRVSLSGTMAAIGLLYLFLAWFPLRQGEHWARAAFLASGIAGFGSFFLFLGYGYFDPLHAAVSLALLPFFLMALWRTRGIDTPSASPNLRNDRSWRMAQWGQLILVGLGAAILTAGLTISYIGITHVFVPEDLAFMETTADLLRSANPRLVPLIAHDRAGFGGALVCNGLTVLLMALWGFRQGARWLWWAMGLSGTASYLAALWTHISVGYVDQIHLLPVYVGMGALYLALTLSYRYLWASDRVA